MMFILNSLKHSNCNLLEHESLCIYLYFKIKTLFLLIQEKALRLIFDGKAPVSFSLIFYQAICLMIALLMT